MPPLSTWFLLLLLLLLCVCPPRIIKVNKRCCARLNDSYSVTLDSGVIDAAASAVRSTCCSCCCCPNILSLEDISATEAVIRVGLHVLVLRLPRDTGGKTSTSYQEIFTSLSRNTKKGSNVQETLQTASL